MYVSRYHKFLRISLLVTAFVLVFDSGLLFNVTKNISDDTISYVGSVGSSVFASVPPNEINTLTAQISEQQRILDAREAALNEREIAGRTFTTNPETDYSTYIISTILFIIIVLLVLNYALDLARVRNMTYERANS